LVTYFLAIFGRVISELPVELQCAEASKYYIKNPRLLISTGHEIFPNRRVVLCCINVSYCTEWATKK